jgi:hypothetical integral membrane protein (TIGR02206 family)
VVPLLSEPQFVTSWVPHVLLLVTIAVVAVVLVILGRRYRGTPTQRQLSRALAVVFAAILVFNEVYWLFFGPSEIKYSLPLQLCDLAAIAAVWALWADSPTAFALTYFWGLTLTSQALLSPELTGVGFSSLRFLSFFGLHSIAVWAAIYLTWGVGLRPDWRSYRVAVLTTICWGVVMFAFNQVTATNYGFLDTKPQVTSLLDVLGPWPWYLLVEVILGSAVWALITWPWARRQVPSTPDASATWDRLHL